MNEDNRTAYEAVIARRWEARFLSHLDTMRALSRALRRSGLPIYFSEGFNPKPKISYRTPPLSVGHTSECERMRFQLMEPIDAAESAAALGKNIPVGISIINLETLPPGGAKKEETTLEYYALLLDPDGKTDPGSPAPTVPESADLKPVSLDDALSLTLLADPEENRLFIEKHFITGATFLIGTGQNYTRPDGIIKDIPPFSEASAPICFHRKKEI